MPFGAKDLAFHLEVKGPRKLMLKFGEFGNIAFDCGRTPNSDEEKTEKETLRDLIEALREKLKEG